MKRIKINLPSECKLGAYVNCYLYDKDGDITAQKQLEIPIVPAKREDIKKFAQASEDNSFITFTGNNFCYTFSKELGTFVSLVKNNEEQLKSPIRITSMRAPTDNERKMKSKWYWQNIWEGENLDRQFDKVYSCTFNNGVITVNGNLSVVSRTLYFKYTLKYIVSCEGEIQIILDGKVKDNCVWLPRLGFEIKLPYEKSEFTYYGMGPHENYCDMHHGSMVDLYTSDADKEYVDYVVPQEHGNHIRTKILEIKNSLTFEAVSEMEFNVSHYSFEALSI